MYARVRIGVIGARTAIRQGARLVSITRELS